MNRVLLRSQRTSTHVCEQRGNERVSSWNGEQPKLRCMDELFAVREGNGLRFSAAAPCLLLLALLRSIPICYGRSNFSTRATLEFAPTWPCHTLSLPLRRNQVSTYPAWITPVTRLVLRFRASSPCFISPGDFFPASIALRNFSLPPV